MRLESEAEIDAMLRGFEEGTWPVAQWTHGAHVAMAASYLSKLPLDEATIRIRDGIRHYNEAVGGKNTEDSGYHETLTLFWIEVIRRCLCAAQYHSRLEAVQRATGAFNGQRDLFQGCYDFDVVKSREARARWVAPDRWPAEYERAGCA